MLGVNFLQSDGTPRWKEMQKSCGKPDSSGEEQKIARLRGGHWPGTNWSAKRFWLEQYRSARFWLEQFGWNSIEAHRLRLHCRKGSSLGHPRERQRVCQLPPGVAFLPKPWQPFNVLVVAEETLAHAQG